jgi:hypothetical protein
MVLIGNKLLPANFFARSRSSQLARNALVIRRCLSKDVDLGQNVCACCCTTNSSGFDSGTYFQLPSRWELLYQGLHERRRLCIALGFNIPKEAGSTNNVTHEGLLDVLKTYEMERNRQLGLSIDIKTAHVLARDYMRRFVYDGRELGVPLCTAGLWIQCGVLEGEDGVPEAERRHYCGLWFHATCIGIQRAPKGNKAEERIQCLRCLQDRRYRIKPPKIEVVSKLALWDSNGLPRILQNEPDSRISTLHLTCSCGLTTGTGLPCEGMLAVARTCGAVLSFHHYHEHWFSDKLIEFNAPTATFTKNTKLQLDVDAVVGHVTKESAPSHVSEEIKPQKVQVTRPPTMPVMPTLVVTSDGASVENVTDLAGIEVGDAKSDRKKNRRYKSKRLAPRK